MKPIVRLLIIFIISLFATDVALAQIVCDKFQIETKLDGKSLEFFLDTDLPDNTILMVSVSRSYKQKNNNDTYPINYFSEKSTIGEWRYKHIISVDNDVWKRNLLERQKLMSRFGTPFEVSTIDDNIVVSMVVPINQDDPKFGEKNSKLTGNRVSTALGDLRVVRDEVKIPYPLNFSTSNIPVLPSLDPQNLDIGQSYIVTRETPLMPEFNPIDPLKAIERVKKIPKGSVYKVLEKRVDRNEPWYRVDVYDTKKRLIGQGWINSTALLRQGVEPYK